MDRLSLECRGNNVQHHTRASVGELHNRTSGEEKKLNPQANDGRGRERVQLKIVQREMETRVERGIYPELARP